MFSSSLHAVSTLLFLAPALTVAHQNNNERAPRRVACDIYSAGAKCQYDYIVVGGGTAGLVVATRLSSDPRVTVAVVEAGGSGKDNDEIDIPALIGTPFGTDLDWKVSTVPQAHSNNISYYWPRGKVLGGSSALNFLVWDRAAKAEYDAWEALGNPGWNWNTIDNM